MPDQHLPVIVRCHMCRDDSAGLIVTTSHRAYQVAIDHALDYHRRELLADPDAAQAAFTVSADGTPRALARGRRCAV